MNRLTVVTLTQGETMQRATWAMVGFLLVGSVGSAQVKEDLKKEFKKEFKGWFQVLWFDYQSLDKAKTEIDKEHWRDQIDRKLGSHATYSNLTIRQLEDKIKTTENAKLKEELAAQINHLRETFPPLTQKEWEKQTEKQKTERRENFRKLLDANELFTFPKPKK